MMKVVLLSEPTLTTYVKRSRIPSNSRTRMWAGCSQGKRVLEDANIKLASVVSDVFGVTGTAIIEAIMAGHTDAGLLAALAKGSLRKKQALLQMALQGQITPHHCFMLKTHLQALKKAEALISEIDRQVANILVPHQQQLELLTSIPGVGTETATCIIAEIGTDMEVFPSEKHLASWAGVCPGNNESAGKKKSERTTHGNKILKTVLVEAAWAASHTQETCLKRKYNGLIIRRGKKRALIAVGHKILCAAYFILKNLEQYREPNDTVLVEKRKQAQIKRYFKRLHEPGVNPRLNQY